MLRQVVAVGTGTRAQVKGYDIAGKTGTTSDYRDAWFVGYTGGFVSAVWLGRDDNTPMKKVAGGGAPAGIWREFMGAALPGLKAQPIPGGLIEPPPPEAPVADPIGELLDPASATSNPERPEKPRPTEKTKAEDIPY